MAERIDNLLRTQRQMLADISHELRSPLTRIGVSLELLRRGETDVLEPMQTDLDRLNAMIGQVLELTRFELQQPSATSNPVDLRLILEDIIESANYEGRATGKVLILALDPPSTTTCFVPGEAPALRSCLENIIRNALQYSPAQSRIDISLHSAPATTTIRVEDTGPGVPAEYLPQLFAPFFRVPGSAETHPQGSGLGLSIAARVIARHKGTIQATNRQPQGLSVQITLPSR
jgi:two-component system sensor histidine kinase CpxA